MWVPKGILASIDKLCSRFLWARSKVEHVTPWVAWDKISRPKEWGGWGIKHLSFFSKSLAAKLAWRFISTDSLWSSVTKRKYIDLATAIEWVHMPVKSSKNSSVVWNALVALAHTIEQGLAWKVGDSSRVRIGCDPWVGCSKRFALSPDLKLFLNEWGFLFLNQVANPRTTSIWRQGWLPEVDLHLEERWREEWSLFVLDLQNSSVCI